ncbi:MAG TPA: cation:proton antiporter [Verrucomicrobiae bacterium]
MNHVEIIVCLLLLFMAVPDLCRKLGRPALAYAAFIVLGVLLGPVVTPEVMVMLKGAGKIGFLLLLFEVGLEIDLPNWRDLLRPLRFALPWALVQYPVILMPAYYAGLDLVSSLVAAATLTGCSVGMAHLAWKHHPGLSDAERPFVLRVMVTLEMLTIVLIAVGSPMMGEALRWTALLRLGGVVVVIYLAARFARHVMAVFETILQRATHWRTHLLVLLVLAICAVGERLGLSAAKTAFFLGLFMSRVEHEGSGLEEFMAPVSRRFLIPLFFVALGMAVELPMLASWNALLAMGTAGLLLGVREMLHRRWFRLCGDPKAFLLLCPNLTVVALGAAAMIEARKVSNENASWLLLTGFFMTVAAVALLPASSAPRTVSPSDPPSRTS